MQTQTKKLDLVGQVCPWPVIFTVKELKKLENGEVLEVLVDHLPSTINIPSAVKKEGHEILSSKEIDDGVFTVSYTHLTLPTILLV